MAPVGVPVVQGRGDPSQRTGRAVVGDVQYPVVVPVVVLGVVVAPVTIVIESLVRPGGRSRWAVVVGI